MTKLVASSALDMTAWDDQFMDSESADIGEHDSSHYVAVSSVHSFTLAGENFDYIDFKGQIDPIGGTMHALTVADDGSTTIFHLTGAHEDVTTVAGFLNSGDWAGLEADLFAGKDTFTGSSHNDHFLGFGGRDTLIGKGGADILSGDGDADTLTGGTGPDRFDYNLVSDSTSLHFDRITDLDTTQDHIGITAAITDVDPAISGGTLSKAHFNHTLENLVGGHELHQGHAVLFTAEHGTYKNHTFLIIDANHHVGYQHGADYLIDVTGIHGALHENDFIAL